MARDLGGEAMDVQTRELAMAQLPDRIAFLGLGLIGGSIALALRAGGYRGSLAAWTPSGRGPAEALHGKLIDDAPRSPEAVLEGAGLVILAGPPLAIVEHLSALAGPWRRRLDPDATLTDVGSTKSLIVESASRYQLPFVGGHPMAGRESTGVEAATAHLFQTRPWVVIPSEGARGLDTDAVWTLALATGAVPLLLDAGAHDRAVAAISHLPLVVAAALVESVATGDHAGDWPTARRLAASGWRDMSRLAKGDPEMGAGILATSAAPVRDRLVALRATLDGWIEQLSEETPDADVLRKRLDAARAAIARPEKS